MPFANINNARTFYRLQGNAGLPVLILSHSISCDHSLWDLQVEDLLPVISFGSKKDGDTEKKHGEFVARMVGRGYTERLVRRLVEWYMRVKQAG